MNPFPDFLEATTYFKWKDTKGYLKKSVLMDKLINYQFNLVIK